MGLSDRYHLSADKCNRVAFCSSRFQADLWALSLAIWLGHSVRVIDTCAHVHSIDEWAIEPDGGVLVISRRRPDRRFVGQRSRRVGGFVCGMV